MPGPQVRIEGLRNLLRTLREFEGGIEDLKDANAKVADLIAREAKQRAPRKSGALAGSIRGNRAQSKATVKAGSAKVPYAGPIHWGWPRRHIAANKFITEAAADTENEWLDMYEKDLQRMADKVEGI